MFLIAFLFLCLANFFQHRACISGLIDDCVEKCRIRLSDLDAVAVSSRPGMVLSLKVGVDTALFLARYYLYQLQFLKSV